MRRCPTPQRVSNTVLTEGFAQPSVTGTRREPGTSSPNTSTGRRRIASCNARLIACASSASAPMHGGQQRSARFRRVVAIHRQSFDDCVTSDLLRQLGQQFSRCRTIRGDVVVDVSNIWRRRNRRRRPPIRAVRFAIASMGRDPFLQRSVHTRSTEVGAVPLNWVTRPMGDFVVGAVRVGSSDCVRTIR